MLLCWWPIGLLYRWNESGEVYFPCDLLEGAWNAGESLPYLDVFCRSPERVDLLTLGEG